MADPAVPDTSVPDTSVPGTADTDTDAPAAGRSDRSGRRRSRSATWQKWSRLIHAYTSMIALLVVLFFGATGITLNHPEWTFGDDPTTTTKQGSLGFDVGADGQVDFLKVSELLRDRYGISAPVSDHQLAGDQGSVSYRAPGYAADATFSLARDTYKITIEQQGVLGVLNDLHKGRDAGSAWKWVIDVSAGFLVLIAVSGLILQLVLKRRRRSAMVIAAVGAVAAVAFMFLAL